MSQESEKQDITVAENEATETEPIALVDRQQNVKPLQSVGSGGNGAGDGENTTAEQSDDSGTSAVAATDDTAGSSSNGLALTLYGLALFCLVGWLVLYSYSKLTDRIDFLEYGGNAAAMNIDSKIKAGDDSVAAQLTTTNNQMALLGDRLALTNRKMTMSNMDLSRANRVATRANAKATQSERLIYGAQLASVRFVLAAMAADTSLSASLRDQAAAISAGAEELQHRLAATE